MSADDGSRSSSKSKGKRKSSNSAPRVTVTSVSASARSDEPQSPGAASTQKSRRRRPHFSRNQVVISVEAVSDDASENDGVSAAEQRRRQVEEYQTRWTDIHKVRKGL